MNKLLNLVPWWSKLINKIEATEPVITLSDWNVPYSELKKRYDKPIKLQEVHVDDGYINIRDTEDIINSWNKKDTVDYSSVDEALNMFDVPKKRNVELFRKMYEVQDTNAKYNFDKSRMEELAKLKYDNLTIRDFKLGDFVFDTRFFINVKNKKLVQKYGKGKYKIVEPYNDYNYKFYKNNKEYYIAINSVNSFVDDFVNQINKIRGDFGDESINEAFKALTEQATKEYTNRIDISKLSDEIKNTRESIENDNEEKKYAKLLKQEHDKKIESKNEAYYLSLKGKSLKGYTFTNSYWVGDDDIKLYMLNKGKFKLKSPTKNGYTFRQNGLTYKITTKEMNNFLDKFVHNNNNDNNEIVINVEDNFNDEYVQINKIVTEDWCEFVLDKYYLKNHVPYELINGKYVELIADIGLYAFETKDGEEIYVERYELNKL